MILSYNNNDVSITHNKIFILCKGVALTEMNLALHMQRFTYNVIIALSHKLCLELYIMNLSDYRKILLMYKMEYQLHRMTYNIMYRYYHFITLFNYYI